MTSQIIGLGGGGFTMEKTPLLDLYIVSAANKKNPTVCLLPTASGDNIGLIEYFKLVFDSYGCNTKYLTLMSPRISNMEKFLLESDIIYVSGGNTKSMLGLWREWGIDKILKKAYENGVVLAGVSAGFVCWFEQCVTDSIPHKLTSMNCLGLLQGSGCPHYDSESNRRDAYHKLIANDKIVTGYAADDGVGLHFVDGKLIKTISSIPTSYAYKLHKENDLVIENKIQPHFLGNENNFNKYIATTLDNLKNKNLDNSKGEL